MKIIFNIIIISFIFYSNYLSYSLGNKIGKNDGKIDAEIRCSNELERQFQENKVCREFNIPYPGKYEACFNKRKCLISIKD